MSINPVTGSVSALGVLSSSTGDLVKSDLGFSPKSKPFKVFVSDTSSVMTGIRNATKGQ